VARYDSSGRSSQKRRTRAALKAAAAELVREGAVPAVADVAERAGISRATAYRYFPNQDALLAEVLLDEVVQAGLERIDHAANAGGTAAERLAAVVRADHGLVIENEEAFRTAVRAMMLPHAEGGRAAQRRPGNRLRYLTAALEPVAEQLGPERTERLVSALAMCVGLESVLVVKDVCGLSDASGEKVKLWAARALLRAALLEAGEDPNA
jgi:AcrR family transcriptional regulator